MNPESLALLIAIVIAAGYATYRVWYEERRR